MGDHKGGAGRQSGSKRLMTPPVTNAPQAEANYRTFIDDTDAYLFMEEHYKAQTDGLSQDERTALRWWSGSYFASINLYLRKGLALDEDSHNILTHMDTVMARENMRVDHDLMAKRAFGSYLDEIKKLPVGTVLTDNGFTPVSVNTGSVNWGAEEKFPAVTIRVPRGTRSIWMQPISAFREEGELLLKRGTSFKIVQNDSGGVVLDVVGQM